MLCGSVAEPLQGLEFPLNFRAIESFGLKIEHSPAFSSGEALESLSSELKLCSWRKGVLSSSVLLMKPDVGFFLDLTFLLLFSTYGIIESKLSNHDENHRIKHIPPILQEKQMFVSFNLHKIK